MLDVGDGPSPFASGDEETPAGTQLITLTARPIPRPPRPLRPVDRNAR